MNMRVVLIFLAAMGTLGLIAKKVPDHTTAAVAVARSDPTPTPSSDPNAIISYDCTTGPYDFTLTLTTIPVYGSKGDFMINSLLPGRLTNTVGDLQYVADDVYRVTSGGLVYDENMPLIHKMRSFGKYNYGIDYGGKNVIYCQKNID